MANPANKQHFINLLDTKLNANAIPTLNADGHANLLIAKTAVEYATRGITHVIGEDTDILVLLYHHAKPGTKGLYFKSEKSANKYPVWNILLLRESLGEQVCQLLLFIHAICGCDTTSRLYGIGKATALKKAQTDDVFVKQAKIFCSMVIKFGKLVKEPWSVFMEAGFVILWILCAKLNSVGKCQRVSHV